MANFRWSVAGGCRGQLGWLLVSGGRFLYAMSGMGSYLAGLKFDQPGFLRKVGARRHSVLPSPLLAAKPSEGPDMIRRIGLGPQESASGQESEPQARNLVQM